MIHPSTGQPVTAFHLEYLNTVAVPIYFIQESHRFVPNMSLQQSINLKKITL